MAEKHTVATEGGSRYQLLQIVLPPLVTLALGIAGTAWFGDWFKSHFPSSSSANAPTSIKRAVVYAKILFFRDRRVGEPYMTQKTLNLIGGEIEKPNEKLYDEAFYLRAYYLHSPHPDRLKFEGHSSGVVDVSPILPSSASFETHLYRQSGFQRLPYETEVHDQDYVLVAHHYYNGFQFNEKTSKYESDGGVHFSYAADEAVIIFDFSALTNGASDSTFRLKKNPNLWIRRAPNEVPSILESRFVNGVLTSKNIEKISEGTHVYCDWEWDTEKQ